MTEALQALSITCFAASWLILVISGSLLRQEFLARRKRQGWMDLFCFRWSDWDKMLLMKSRWVKWVWLGVIGVAISLCAQLVLLYLRRLMNDPTP